MDDGNALYFGRRKYTGQPVNVERSIIKFRASDNNGIAPQNTLMKISEGEGHAVGDKKKVRVHKDGGLGRDQPELDRPVCKL